MIDGPGSCLVVGDTPKGKLVTQVIDSLSEYSATQMDEEALRSTGNSSDLTEYNLLVEVTGNSEIAKQSIQKARQGSVILLLGNRYEKFNLTNKAVLEKTVVKSETDSNLNLGDTIDTVSNLEVNSILDGTYDMEEFNTARRLAMESEQFPVISVES